jgi:hypothetical protein
MRPIRACCWICCLLAGACASQRVATPSADVRPAFVTLRTSGNVRFRVRPTAALPAVSFRVRFTLSAERRPLPASICLLDDADPSAASAVVARLPRMGFPDFSPGEHVVAAVATPAVFEGAESSVRWLFGFPETRGMTVDFGPAQPGAAEPGPPRRC